MRADRPPFLFAFQETGKKTGEIRTSRLFTARGSDDGPGCAQRYPHIHRKLCANAMEASGMSNAVVLQTGTSFSQSICG